MSDNEQGMNQDEKLMDKRSMHPTSNNPKIKQNHLTHKDRISYPTVFLCILSPRGLHHCRNFGNLAKIGKASMILTPGCCNSRNSSAVSNKAASSGSSQVARRPKTTDIITEFENRPLCKYHFSGMCK